jgi:hypothetical protein
MQMFDINLLVQVIPIFLSGYPTVLWIKHYSSICKQYVLKNEAKNCIVPNYVLTKVSPHMFFSKAKYQSHCQVSTTQCIVVNFKTRVLFVVQNIWMHKVLSFTEVTQFPIKISLPVILSMPL